jgi:DNA polymerase-3 subunit epsilon
VRGAELVIHNAAFDVEFLNVELEKLGLEPIANHVAAVLDTLGTARELHPGKKNSLDALCERYQIDNSHRTLHGALLDATLLAEVYLAMTRGQESLAIGLETPAAVLDVAIAFSGERPRIILQPASAEELAEHARLLESIAKETKGKLVWEVEAVPA